MYSSVKSFVPMRTGVGDGAGAVAVGVVATSSPPPQAPSPSASVARTASPMARTALISGARTSRGRLGPGVGAALGRGQGEVEDAALARRARDPDPAAVLVDDALADGEADARAGVVLLTMEALEGLEDALGVIRVHADAVVADREAPQAVAALGLDANPRPLLAR